MVTRPLAENFAPYAPASTVVEVIQRLRERGLPDPLTQTGLEQIGISGSMASFVLRTLVFLRLIDEGGNLTEAANQLRRATREEYPETLAQTVRTSYESIFRVADPAADDEVRVSDAFRPFEPPNQRDKMVRLFMGLCEEAGIIPRGTVRQRKSVPPEARVRRERGSAVGGNPPPPFVSPPPPPAPPTDKLHPGLAGLIGDLPVKAIGWPKAERDRWLAAFTNSLDYAYPANEGPSDAK